MSKLRYATVVCGLLALAGCGREYERAEVARVVVPFNPNPPPAGEVIQPLPPMKDLGIDPDTTDGSLLMRIDRYRFWVQNGYDFPAYEPRRTTVAETDTLAAVIVRVRQDMLAITRMLDDVFAPLDQGINDQASRRQPTLVFTPDEWSGFSARLLLLTGAVDRLAVESGTPHQTDSREEKARTMAMGLWKVMHERAAVLHGASLDLAADPTVRSHVPEGVMKRIQGIVRSAGELKESCKDQRPLYVMPLMRTIQRDLDSLEADAGWARLFGLDGSLTSIQRNDIRAKLVAVRKGVVGVAAQWGANQASLLEHQPEPTLVYPTPVNPAARLD